MAKRNARYTHPGGVLGVPRRVIRSPAYRDLTLPARCLMLELQDVWRPSEPDVHYSARRAATALNVSKSTASTTFHELVDHGFINRVGASDWLNGKARTYRLTWLSHDGREPTNEWMRWSEKLKKGFGHRYGQGGNRPISGTVTQNRTNSPTKKQQVSDDSHHETVQSQVHH